MSLKIFLTGGGTMGSVMPLLALVPRLKENFPEIEIFWIGTKKGPEKRVIKNYQLNFKGILGGKWRRYFSWRNFLDLFLILLGFFQSIFIILKYRPHLIISAGGFIGVPLIWAGWILRKKIIIHQQDLKPGLANKLTSPFAQKITVVFEESSEKFPFQKTIWLGNFIREEILEGSKERARKIFHLKENFPTLLILGGGTGALSLNQLVWQILPELLKFSQIIHVTGRGKNFFQEKFPTYHPYEFLLNDLRDAYAVADLVISRAGLSTLSELSILAKPTILIPLPGSHQEKNASYFEKKKAVIVLRQKDLKGREFLEEIKKILLNPQKLDQLKRNIKGLIPFANNKMIKLIKEVVQKSIS